MVKAMAKAMHSALERKALPPKQKQEVKVTEEFLATLLDGDNS